MSSNGQQAASALTVASRCLAVVLKPANDQTEHSVEVVRTEREIFQDFVDENRTCYWNPHLKESIENLRFAGYLLDSFSLLLAGRDIYLNTVLDAWSRRVLRPPQGFAIHSAGEICRLDIQTPSQCLFTPLPEVLCLIISDCNRVHVCATFDVILAQLQQHYSSIQQPEETFVYATLEDLMKDRKIYHSGSGYFIVTPDTLQLNNCITVVDNHVIIGNTGSHDNGIRAIYLPLLAAGKTVASEKKSASCQTETEAISKGSAEAENTKTPAKDKISTKAKLCQAGSKKDKSQSGKISNNSRNSSPDTSFFNRNSGELGSLLKRILYRNKKSAASDAVQTVKEEILAITTPSEGTMSASRPKSHESKRLQTLSEKREPVKADTKSATKSNNTREISGLFRHSCLSFTTRKKSPVKDDMENGTGLIPKRQTKPQRSRSMSPDSRSSTLNLTLDEIATEKYKASKSRTLEIKQKSVSTKKQPSLKSMQHFKSTESLYDFDFCDRHPAEKIFEMELSRPHEVIVKTKRTVLEHFPDSQNYISRVYRKYHKMKGASARKVSRYTRHHGSLSCRAGQSLSHDSGLNHIGEEVESQGAVVMDSPFLEFQRQRNGRSNIEPLAERAEHLVHKADVHTPAAEDSGFLSFQLGSAVSPLCLSMEPIQNPIQRKTAAADSLLEADKPNLPPAKAVSQRPKCSAQRNQSLSCASIPQDSAGHAYGLVHMVDSCQTGSSWSNSSRQTVVDVPSEQIARINPDDILANEFKSVTESCCLATPSFNLEKSLQVDPLMLPESKFSSFSRTPSIRNQTDGFNLSPNSVTGLKQHVKGSFRSPDETTCNGFERQRSGRTRLRGVSSKKEVCN